MFDGIYKLLVRDYNLDTCMGNLLSDIFDTKYKCIGSGDCHSCGKIFIVKMDELISQEIKRGGKRLDIYTKSDIQKNKDEDVSGC